MSLCFNEQVREFLGGVPDPDKCAARFEEMLHDDNAPNWSIFLEEGSRFIGMINIDRHHDGVEYEISYQFLPDFWGQGLAQETVKAAIVQGLATLSRRVILAETQTGNRQSAALLGKLGFQEVDRVMRFGEMQSIYEYRT